MYIQGKFNEPRTASLQALMREHPLGALVLPGAEGLDVNHMPFFLDPEPGEFGVLRAHMPRANPAWRNYRAGRAGEEAVVIFQGAESYVSPNWYPSKQEHGRVVPTWNYAVVHAYGSPAFIEDRDWLRRQLGELTNAHEASFAHPWRLEDAPADYVDAMLAALVGIEIPISRLLGKRKLSQNRPPADRRGVAEGLRELGTESAAAMAALVEAAGGESGKA